MPIDLRDCEPEYMEPGYLQAQNLVLDLYRDTIHYQWPQNRWHSRDPDTGRWSPDRGGHRRLTLLQAAVRQLRATDGHSRRAVRQMSSTRGQHTFLQALALRMRDLPEPADFHTFRN